MESERFKGNDMNSKKANWAFLITIAAYLGMTILIALFFPAVAENLVLSNLICETVLLLPILLFLFTSRDSVGMFFPFHKIKFTSVLMIGLFTFLSVPFLTLLNLFSQLWVDNEVALAMENLQITEMPFGLVFLSMAIIAPVFEEVICRGAYYNSYRKSSGAFKGMVLSALIFALFHMNFNQASYAFVMGVMAVLLVEATGSLWSSILYHGFINGSQVILMYTVMKDNPSLYTEQAELMTTDVMLYGIGAYLLIVAVTLPLAWAVLVWISKNEKKEEALSAVWRKRKEKKDKIVTVPLVLGLILCAAGISGIFFQLVLKVLEYTL